MGNEDRAFPALRILYSLFAVPIHFLLGFLVGVAAPVAAITAMVLGVRFLTGKMPFLSLSQDEEEDQRHLSVALVPAEQASDLFAAEKQKVLDELSTLREELKAMMEEAKAQQAATGEGKGGTDA